MDQEDLKALDKLFDKKLKPINETLELHSNLFKEFEEKLDTNTASVMKIEQKINAALELRQDVSEVRETLKDHEERLSNLETL